MWWENNILNPWYDKVQSENIMYIVRTVGEWCRHRVLLTYATLKFPALLSEMQFLPVFRPVILRASCSIPLVL